MGFDNKNERLRTVLVVETSRSHDTVSPTRSIRHEEVSIDLFYLYLICLAERDEELDLFVGNPALLRRILTWSGLVKRARSVPLFLREVLMFL